MNLNTLITTFFIGIFASIAFILIQPLFGMLTLTSRHATAYMEIGNYSAIIAMTLSWLVHIGVSVFYTFISLSIYNINHSILVSFLQIIVLGWVTTLIATPANEWVVKFITTGQLTTISSLSDLNTQVGPKLWLHILFFALVIVGISFTRFINDRNNEK
ncbi:hypothetical protein Q4574_05210 [Aliiglaciecola sp. 3_MG-2023]|uniref:hypothetical protein n=1 Tax=Aliiglaciecola sp. 3_MG-2023 TaxID=3062644 RepID=UPI0026E44DD6|nr:hypothetical protein [Aliiglaciecola sp. 3_MG-2023]MDO6692669.1 hypothetical protein [Aliiglaciecola sp. 3_MG-2023]